MSRKTVYICDGCGMAIEPDELTVQYRAMSRIVTAPRSIGADGHLCRDCGEIVDNLTTAGFIKVREVLQGVNP